MRNFHGKISLYTRIKFAWLMLKILRNPENTGAVFDLGNSIAYKLPALDNAVKKAKADTQAASLFHERFLAPPLDMEELLKCPEGSLGRSFATHMKQNKLDPDFYPKSKV